MKQVMFIISFLGLAFQTQAQPSTEHQKFQPILHSLFESLNNKDYSIIEPFIHEDFTFKTYGGSMGIMIMKQVVAGYPNGLKKIEITNVKDSGGHYELQTIFYLPTGQEDQVLLVSKDLKLLKADVVDIQLAGHSAQSDKSEKKPTFPFNDKRPEKVEIPLILNERDMFVEAAINGKKGKFYFDTGAPSLILNGAAFADDDLLVKGKSDKKLSGATGKVEGVMDLVVKDIEVSGLKAKEVTALSYDLSHLDKASLGMIGMDIMKGYLTVFNLKDTKINMYKLDEEGKIKDQSLLDDFVPVEVKMLGHLPMITVEIDGQKLNLLVDSGASSAMLHPKYRELLKGHYEFLEEDTLRGHGKVETPIEVFNLKELSLANKTFQNIRVLFENFVDEKEYGHEKVQVDGLIGWDIFYQAVVAYNLDNNLIYIKN